MKFLNFFLFLWVIFALLDSDPDPDNGSTDLIESGSETKLSNKDLQDCPVPWFFLPDGPAVKDVANLLNVQHRQRFLVRRRYLNTKNKRSSKEELVEGNSQSK
jgi:hypothetical protein